MILKETVDKYLLANFNDIEQLRTSQGFNWNSILYAIEQSEGLIGKLFTSFENGQYAKPHREYVRKRFLTIRNKEKSWVEQQMGKLEEVGKINFVNHITSSIPTISNFKYVSGKQDNSKGTKEFSFTADNIPTEEEIIKHFNIDITKWKIVNIYHKTSFSGKYSITVQTNLLKGVETISLDQNFIEKLKFVLPYPHLTWTNNSDNSNKPIASLLIPKQDAHWNKRDIDGKNSIEDRFKTFTQTLLGQLEKIIKTNNLEKITYIIGSDEFNSEWTKATTHGTPQDNILTYQQAFEKISEFNIETIKYLRFYAPKVEVVLLNGNHDHNAGWHLATLLKQVFKKNETITVNDSIDNTKVLNFHSTLVLANHGDAIKPRDLAAKFPIIAKDIWSEYKNFMLITGDKHHEVSHDFHGTMWYQVPQLSTAKSDWDDKKGFITSKAELLLFLFEEDGLSNILRKQIK